MRIIGISAAALALALLGGQADAQGVPAAAWQGPHLDLDIGAGFGTSRKNFTPGTTTGDFDISGFVGGLGGGYDWQINRWVVGVEANIWGTSIGGSKTCPSPLFRCETSSDWLATVRPRVGYTFDRLLIYGTGGLAVGDIGVRSVVIATNAAATDFHRTEVGWTLGAGLDYAIAAPWVLKARYLYLELEDANGPIAGSPGTSRTQFNQNIFQLGVSYRF
jgi:outer membrane immunogenic protein